MKGRTDKQRLAWTQQRLAGARKERDRLRLENRALKTRLARWGRPKETVRRERRAKEPAPELPCMGATNARHSPHDNAEKHQAGPGARGARTPSEPGTGLAGAPG